MDEFEPIKNPFRSMASDMMDEIRNLIIENKGREDILNKNYHKYENEIASILFDERKKDDNELLKPNSRLLNYIIKIAEDCGVDESVISKEIRKGI